MAHSSTGSITLVLENARFGRSYIERKRQLRQRAETYRLQLETTLPCRLPSVATTGKSERMFCGNNFE